MCIPLALESEWDWGWGDVQDDFEKLLVSAPRLKVLIFRQYGTAPLAGLVDDLSERVAVFRHDSPANYLLCGLDAEAGVFRFEEIAAQTSPD